jgi:hypothetical protein
MIRSGFLKRASSSGAGIVILYEINYVRLSNRWETPQGRV